MANVAGAIKKSAMAVAIFIAYYVENIVAPQFIKSQTKARHYPELWEELIICYCTTIAAATALSLALLSDVLKAVARALIKSPDFAQ